MQTRSWDELSVRPSVCPSIKRVVCDKTEERSVQIFFIPHERSFSLDFWEENGWWPMVGATPSTWNLGSIGQRWSEIADFESIFARSASVVTPSEKSSINTNTKSTARFPISLRWSLYVAPKPPIGVSKTQNGRFFRIKSHFAWRKSATKFLCVKTVSDKVVRHSLA